MSNSEKIIALISTGRSKSLNGWLWGGAIRLSMTFDMEIVPLVGQLQEVAPLITIELREMEMCG